MSERPRPDIYLPFRTPEWQQPHGSLLTRAQAAALDLWRPNPDASGFTYNVSASCEALTACFLPPDVANSDPKFGVVLNGPSRRGREGMDRSFGLIGYIESARFIMHSPEDSARLGNRGVSCEVFDYADRPLYADSITYWQFEHFANISGLFEPASRGQRIGRRILTILDSYVQAHDPSVQLPPYPGRII